MYEHILIPTDGSDCARHAVQEGLRLARELGSKVTFLHVLENPLTVAYAAPEAVGYASQLREDLQAAAQDVLDESRELARQAGVAAETRLVERNDPARTIREEAANYDLVVMGTHGRRGFDRWVFGSVAEGAVRGAPRPFLLVRDEPEEG